MADQPIDATLGPYGDEDWFRVELPEGVVGRVEVVPVLGPLSVSVFAPDGFTLKRASTERIWVKDADLVRVRAFVPSASVAYRVTLTFDGLDDFPDDLEHAALVTPGQVGGAIDFEADVDVVEIAAPPAMAVSIFSLQLPAGGGADLLDGRGGFTRLIGPVVFTLPAGRRAFVRFTSPQRAPWSLGVTLLGHDDWSDDQLFADDVPLLMAMSGHFDRPGDIDSMRVPQIAGHFYQPLCPPALGCDPPWRALDSTPRAWSVWLGAADNGVGDWSASVDDLGLDEDERGPVTVELETSSAGAIQFRGDVDRFVLDAPARRCIALSAVGAALRVRDPQGHELGDAGAVQALRGGRYTLEVSASTSAVSRYVLEVFDLGPDEAQDDRATATTLGPGTVLGLLPVGDRDVFTLTPDPSHTWSLSCTALETGTCSLLVDGLAAYQMSGASFSFAGVANRLFVEPRLDGGLGYRLSLRDLGTDDFPNTPATSIELDAGSIGDVIEVQGTFEATGDLDAFNFVSSGGVNWSCTCYVDFLPSAGTSFTVVHPSGTRVFATAHRSFFDRYTLRLENVGPDDFDCVAPWPLFPGPVSGRRNGPGDNDCVRLATVPRHIYRTTLNGGYVNTNGFDFIASSTDTPFNIFTLANWTLSIADVGIDDFPSTASDALAVDLIDAGLVVGRVDIVNDADAFRLGVGRGDLVTFSFDAGPGFAASFGGWTVNSGTTVQLGVGNKEVLVWSSSPGPYEVSATVAPDDFSGEVPTLLDGGTVLGHVHPGDVDLFMVNVTGRGTINATLNGSGTLSITTPEGNRVYPPYSVSSPGAYLIEVFQPTNASSGAYTLSGWVSP